MSLQKKNKNSLLQYRSGGYRHGYEQRCLRGPSLPCLASLCWPGISLRSDNDNSDQLFSRREDEEESRSDGQILQPLLPLFIPSLQFSSVAAEQGLRRPERCLWGFFSDRNMLESSCLQWQNEYFWEAWWLFKCVLERKQLSCQVVLVKRWPFILSRFHCYNALKNKSLIFPFAKPSHIHTLMEVQKETRRVWKIPPELVQRCEVARERLKYVSTYGEIWSGYKAISSSATSRYRLRVSVPFHMGVCVTQRLWEVHLYLQENSVEGKMLFIDYGCYYSVCLCAAAPRIPTSRAVFSGWLY